MMSSILKMLMPFTSIFGGPFMGLAEKGFTAFVIWMLAKGSVDPTSAAGIASEFWIAISATISAVNKSQTAKIAALNSADNGVAVVKKVDAVEASIPTVTTPQ
jgi:hypothetical protein